MSRWSDVWDRNKKTDDTAIVIRGSWNKLLAMFLGFCGIMYIVNLIIIGVGALISNIP